MADQVPQNLGNHTRLDPLFHYFLLPMFALNFLYHVYELVRLLINGGDGWLRSTGSTVVALGFLLLTLKCRLYSLKVQDRLIRLEERLRMASLLPGPLQARVPELTEAQLIALRFASDGELTAMVQETCEKKLGPKEIKAGVRNWRADFFRV